MFGIELHPNGIGLLAAAIAAAGGAPLFSDGLRAVRLRRSFAGLRATDLGLASEGFGEVRGRVALESPLFAPLSGKPCAGFRLEARVSGSRSMSVIEEHRAFLIASSGRTARVMNQRSRWELPVSAERDFAAGDVLSDRLASLIQRAPEMAWARGAGATLHLVERALFAGSICHVVGTVHQGRAIQMEDRVELLRTGTDGLAVDSGGHSGSGVENHEEPELWVGNGEHLDFLYISDRASEPTRLAPPEWRVAGAIVGPLLSLAGLTYLAGALDALRALGR
jgi:hypothetical protein